MLSVYSCVRRRTCFSFFVARISNENFHPCVPRRKFCCLSFCRTIINSTSKGCLPLSCVSAVQQLSSCYFAPASHFQRMTSGTTKKNNQNLTLWARCKPRLFYVNGKASSSDLALRKENSTPKSNLGVEYYGAVKHNLNKKQEIHFHHDGF